MTQLNPSMNPIPTARRNARAFRQARPQAAGFTLVELMVAMTISLLVLAGIVQVFISNQQTHRSQEANARLQENGRTAIALLQRDIRPVGYQGCRSMRKNITNTIASPPVPTIDASNVITGYEATGSSPGTWSPSLPTAITSSVRDGTDAITVQGATTCSEELTATMTSDTAPVVIGPANNCAMTEKQLVMVADCTSTDIFRLSSVVPQVSGVFVPVTISNRLFHATTASDGSTVNTQNTLSKTYPSVSDLLILQSYTYYIAILQSFTYYIAPGADGPPSLWRLDNTNGSQTELVSDVEDMQIEYGLDTDADQAANYYVKANQVGGNWRNVISLRISLLLSSRADNVATSPQSYTFNRNAFTAPDKRIRRIFTTTIQLRNQVS